jgi:hypothetical protein
MHQLSFAETLLVAVLLGVALTFSARKQYQLQQLGMRDEKAVPLLERIMYYGLSFSILCLAVISGREISALEYENFMLTFFAAAGATWFVFYLKRSNRQFDRDA